MGAATARLCAQERAKVEIATASPFLASDETSYVIGRAQAHVISSYMDDALKASAESQK